MQTPSIYGVGGVVTADIAVPEHAREHAFYASILTTGDAPLWREDLANNLGTPVIGLGRLTSETDGLPLQWMPHMQVADVAASVARAIELGGTELMHGKNAEGQSQWAVLIDPVGAAFGVVPVVASGVDAAVRHERCGCIAWLSLTAPDAAAIRDFYQRVVGWTASSTGTEERGVHSVRFEMQTDKGTAAAEIRPLQDGERGFSSVWLMHLPVDDLAESLRRVTAGGGDVIQEVAEGTYAVVRDPVGVVLALQAG